MDGECAREDVGVKDSLAEGGSVVAQGAGRGSGEGKNQEERRASSQFFMTLRPLSLAFASAFSSFRPAG